MHARVSTSIYIIVITVFFYYFLGFFIELANAFRPVPSVTLRATPPFSLFMTTHPRQSVQDPTQKPQQTKQRSVDTKPPAGSFKS